MSNGLPEVAGVASVELRWLAIGAVEQRNGLAETRAPGVPFLVMSESVLMASSACLRASSWRLWARFRAATRIAGSRRAESVRSSVLLLFSGLVW